MQLRINEANLNQEYRQATGAEKTVMDKLLREKVFKELRLTEDFNASELHPQMQKDIPVDHQKHFENEKYSDYKIEEPN